MSDRLVYLSGCFLRDTSRWCVDASSAVHGSDEMRRASVASFVEAPTAFANILQLDSPHYSIIQRIATCAHAKKHDYTASNTLIARWTRADRREIALSTVLLVTVPGPSFVLRYEGPARYRPGGPLAFIRHTGLDRFSRVKNLISGQKLRVLDRQHACNFGQTTHICR